MSKWYEDLSSVVKIATDILFAKNPVGTSLGVVSGIVLHGLLGFLSPLLVATAWVNVNLVKWYHCIAVGIFAFNIVPYLNRKKIDSVYEKKIKFIEAQVRLGVVSKLEAKQLYQNVIAEAVENKQAAS